MQMGASNACSYFWRVTGAKFLQIVFSGPVFARKIATNHPFADLRLGGGGRLVPAVQFLNNFAEAVAECAHNACTICNIRRNTSFY